MGLTNILFIFQQITIKEYVWKRNENMHHRRNSNSRNMNWEEIEFFKFIFSLDFWVNVILNIFQLCLSKLKIVFCAAATAATAAISSQIVPPPKQSYYYM